jgi:hypothetical protein
MAKKAHTPPPPRQGPKKQQGPQKRQSTGAYGPRKPRSAMVAGVLVGGAIVAVLLVLVGIGRKGSNAAIKVPTSQMTAAGCTMKSVKPLPPTHGDHPSAYHEDVPTLTSKVRWSTDPPSAGGHYPLWAVWDFYDTPVNPRRVVHNEEHGGVIIWWGDKVPASTVDQLRAFYDESPVGMFGTPYPSLGDKIALTAWTRLPGTYYENANYGTGQIAICPHFDEKAFRAFRDAFRGKGPEGVPLDADQPGSGPNG